LISDGANTTNPRRHIRNILKRSSDQQGFEEPRRLVDRQVDAVDAIANQFDLKGAFALNPR
jgi:hypothetical protein